MLNTEQFGSSSVVHSMVVDLLVSIVVHPSKCVTAKLNILLPSLS